MLASVAAARLTLPRLVAPEQTATCRAQKFHLLAEIATATAQGQMHFELEALARSQLAVLGFGYSWWARRRKAELEDALDLTPQDAPYNNANTPDEILDMSMAPSGYRGVSAIKSI